MIEWFCFPDGCKLWRGPEAPTHMDMDLKRFSASSPPTMASSIAAFDACLNCTTSFTWFVLTANPDSYGSAVTKTYGACIRFYVPAPPGIDRTQDDYAQMIMGGGGPGGAVADSAASPGASSSGKSFSMVGDGAHEGTMGVSSSSGMSSSRSKRLWVPMGIVLTTHLPIVGILEAMLLRLCETLASRANGPGSMSARWVRSVVHRDLANLIINYQVPLGGLLHQSVPFLSGERLHLTLPPLTGLPPLPHGASVTSVCRLLGAEGLTVLLAAVLTECKVLIHSQDVANLGMVGEVITALIYPFFWILPYLPVLTLQLLELVDAPVSYFFGVPSSSMQYIDKTALSDVVVIDLDNGFSSPDYFDGRRNLSVGGRVRTPLPNSVSSNISKAVFRLLKEEEEVEEQFGTMAFSCGRHLPRLEGESLAEREFRVAVAIQVCSLLRGYQECLFFVSASQPVFNRDRFLRNAPALFEERRGASAAAIQSLGHNPPGSAGVGGPSVTGTGGPGAPHTQGSQGMGGSSTGAGGLGRQGPTPPGTSSSQQPAQRILSPRSKRFLSNLVNTQHFHGLLESLDGDSVAFFHEVMDAIERGGEDKDSLGGGWQWGRRRHQQW